MGSTGVTRGYQAGVSRGSWCLAFSADVRERYELVGESVKGGCVGTSTFLLKGARPGGDRGRGQSQTRLLAAYTQPN